MALTSSMLVLSHYFPELFWYFSINSEYFSAINRHNVSEELVTRLNDKKNCASKNARAASNESTKANLRAKNAFFNTVNARMSNYEISAKKKFSILTKLMKNQKISNIPPLIQNNNVINDSKSKSEHLNDIFVSKASVQGSDDPVPELDPITTWFQCTGNFQFSFKKSVSKPK